MNHKEKPILFSAPMVNAILDGRKTQTRRVIPFDIASNMDTPRGVGDVEAGYPFIESRDGDFLSVKDISPYGRPGDQLWVRETWRIGTWHEEGMIAVDYIADGTRSDWLQVSDPDVFERYFIQCSDDCEKAGLEVDEIGLYWWDVGNPPTRKRPSIFMPRWASRIQLEITDIRVERLQEIDEEDAENEGPPMVDKQGAPCDSAKTAFMTLWDRINFDRGCGWGVNPWVWVVEFKVK